jgi:hypothetical protein
MVKRLASSRYFFYSSMAFLASFLAFASGSSYARAVKLF